MDVTMDAAVMDVGELRKALDAVRTVLAPDLTDQELNLFAMVAHRSRLDPFARQIHAIKRQGRLTFQTGIDGLRSSAEETGEYRGSDEPEFGPMVDKPYPHPEWARVVVHRVFPTGERLAQPATVWWDEYYPGDAQGFQWRKMPRVMIAKVAEASAFRKAFPRRFASVYESAEMDQAYSNDPAPTTTAAPVARDRLAARIDAIAPARPAQDAAGQQETSGRAPDPLPALPVPVAVDVPTADTVLDAPQAAGQQETSGRAPDPLPALPVPVATPDGDRREQCASVDPYEGTTRCRKASGHAGSHRTADTSWV